MRLTVMSCCYKVTLQHQELNHSQAMELLRRCLYAVELAITQKENTLLLLP